MLTLMNWKNIRIVFVTLILAFMLLTESALAKEGRKRSGKSSGGGQKSRQVGKAAAAPSVRRPSNAAKSRPKISAPSRPAKSRIGLSTSKPPSRSKAARIVRTPARQPRSVTSSRSATRRLNITRGAPKSTRSLSAGRKLARVSSSAVKKATARLGSYISSDKTARIGSSISKETFSATTTRKVARDSKSRISIRSDKTARIGSSSSKETSSVTTARKVTRDSKSKIDISKPVSRNNREDARKSKAIGKSERRSEAGRERKNINLKVVNRISTRSRREKAVSESRETTRGAKVVNRARNRITNRKRIVTDSRDSGDVGRRGESHERHRRGRDFTVIYRDPPRVFKRVHRHEHVYRDHRGRLCHRIVWPRYRFGVYYGFGGHFAFRYVYPYYHRKYVFVSLGGYWPVGYGHIRYYWYGCHPYQWYGYYPIAREVQGDTYNYYTYNYYNDDDVAPTESYQAADGIRPVDHTTFADVREKLAQQAVGEPEPETLADSYFEDAVEAFEASEYDIAADIFAKAIELAPDDMILPFAYSQALFADEKYTEAAEVLRAALANVTPEKEGVFYPRGLYAEDDILFEQIDRLAEKAELYSFDGDLQLLLGYQLLGIGEIDEAVEPLRRAGEDLENAASATILLNLLEKIRAQNAEDTDQ